MTARKLMILLVTAVFSIGVASVGFSAQEVEGTISKIEADSIVILDDLGEQLTVHVKNPEVLAKLQTGDRVLIKDGKVKKVGG